MKCQNPKCNIKKACFNYIGLKPGILCFKHKEKNMVNIYSKICIEKNCDKIAYFNNDGYKKPIYCKKHKTKEMRNTLSSEHCQFKGCKVVKAVFNFPDVKHCKLCSKHKEPGMIDVISKKCEFKNCYITPHFNYEGLSKKFCLLHKLENMVDVTHLKCLLCSKRPTYNYIDEIPIFCFKHKLENMVNVISKKCKDCSKIPSFNYKDQSPEYCFDHKLENMVNTRDSKCIKKNCNIQSSFNFPNNKRRLYCGEHKLNGMIDVKSNYFKCLKCNLEYKISSTHKTICRYCNPSIYLKTKELKVKDLLLKNNYKFIHDKSCSINYKDCNPVRPDFLFDCNNYFLILEVDEFKHKGASYPCENNRMNNICFNLGLPCIFLRYNPDNKKYFEKIKHKSLLNRVNYYLKDYKFENEAIHIEYLFY